MPSAQRPLRAAIVGYGNIAPVHLDALSRLPDVRVAAICDNLPARAEAARAERPGVAVHADYREMLAAEKPDMVHVCTPHHLHVPMAIDALRAGCHVVLEKPCAMNAEEGALLLREWKASGRLLAVCFQNRYRPSVREAKRILEEGRYERLLGIRGTVAWKRDKAYYASGTGWRGAWKSEGGGCLVNQAIHTLDLIQWLGGGCSSVSAIAGNLSLRGKIEVEDSAVVSMELAGYAGSASSGGHARGLLFATNAWVEDAPVELEILCEGKRITIHGDDEDTASVAGKNYWGIRHFDLISDFCRCVRSGEPFALDPEEGLKAIAILDAVYADLEASAIRRPTKRNP